MTKVKLRSIPRDPEPPEWKEADEIVPNVWLGAITDNEQALPRGIPHVICISKDPHADLQNEGFRESDSPKLCVKKFTIKRDTDKELLSIFNKVCRLIDPILDHEEGVLVWDRGGGIAAVAAYIMQRYALSLLEALTVITRARLQRPKPTLLPSQRIIALLRNNKYQDQLEKWRARNVKVNMKIILNPNDRPQNWLIEQLPRTNLGWYTLGEAKLPETSEQPHRLSTIAEIKEEAQRLSILEDSLDQAAKSSPPPL